MAIPRPRSRTSRHAFIALASVATLTSTSSAASARPPFPPPPPLERRIESLDLPDSTRERIYAVLDGAEGTRRATQRAIESARRHLRELLADGSSGDDAVRAEATKLADLERSAERQRIDLVLAVRALLPERLRGSLAPPRPERDPRDGGRPCSTDGSDADRHPCGGDPERAGEHDAGAGPPE